MKKLFTIACALVLGGVMSFAQAGGGTAPTTGTQPGTTSTDTGKKAGKKHHKGHKSGKKHKKGSADTTTPPPK